MTSRLTPWLGHAVSAAVVAVVCLSMGAEYRGEVLPQTRSTRLVTTMPHTPSKTAKPATSAKQSKPAPQPFPGQVGAATRQVISVVADTMQSQTAKVTLWQRARGGDWRPVGVPVRADLGQGGLTRTPVDGQPLTPVGSWAMDVVLARDPGITWLPEHVLAPGDGWSSCLSCANYDRLSNSGEMYAGRDSWSRVAIHVVTNPKRIPGRSSGIFLHVSDGAPSAGCIAVPLDVALGIAGWLDPTAQARVVVAVRR